MRPQSTTDSPYGPDQPDATEGPNLTGEPRWLRGFDLGLLAGLGVAVVYGLSAEAIGLTWGLVAVGFVGGIVIAGAVTRGASAGRTHRNLRGIKVLATAIAIGAWIIGVFLAYLISQLLLPQASTSVLARVSLTGFAEYFAGLFDVVRLSHAAALAAMALMAFRGAR